MIKLLFALVFFTSLTGCQLLDEPLNESGYSEEEYNISDSKKDNSLQEQKEYIVFLEEYSEEFNNLKNKLHDFYQKSLVDPLLLNEPKSIESFAEYQNKADSLYLEVKDKRFKNEVPVDFTRIHTLTEAAFEQEKISIEEFLTYLETKETERMQNALYYVELSNHNMEHATTLLESYIQENHIEKDSFLPK